MRRWARYSDTWPINPRAGLPPVGWTGWPQEKQFALVLTHDVEGEAGLNRCRPLLALEKELGFRSCFNFVPEGDYRVSPELRGDLASEGFEIGVHDLAHDGKLYRSRRAFRACAKRINSYLAEWQAVGFRSAFMLHEIQWLHDLNILYDSSTFDTDPFEPQPDGVDTIFPFKVSDENGAGYVELPYTLVQDFSLFIVLEQSSPAIWKQKLDWIAQHGGMALLDTHPDYMSFQPGALDRGCYPVDYYREFLEYASSKFSGRYWQPLPREVAAYINAQNGSGSGEQSRRGVASNL